MGIDNIYRHLATGHVARVPVRVGRGASRAQVP